MNIMRYTIKEEWIRQRITKESIEWANNFGKYLCNKPTETESGDNNKSDGDNDDKNKNKKPLTTSQLRKFFGELRRIDADFDKKYQDVLMLSPMLAYAIGREKTESKLKDFGDTLSEGIKHIRLDDKVHRKTDFKNFLKLFEAIVAYHKYHGGK